MDKYPRYPASVIPDGYTLEEGLDSVGAGWHPLVRRVFTELPNMKIVQVKEKFGALRIYVDHFDDFARNLIGEVEKQSQTMCEICGDEGRIDPTSKHWLRTRCTKHEGEKR